PTITHQLTPTLVATADSTNKLWLNDNIMAIINTSFTVNSKEIIAPMAAYKLRTFPNTNGKAASPGSPIQCITGSRSWINQGKTGVNCKMVTINVIGKITFPNVHVVCNPCFRPRCIICDMLYSPLSLFFPLLRFFLLLWNVFIADCRCFSPIKNKNQSNHNRQNGYYLCSAHNTNDI